MPMDVDVGGMTAVLSFDVNPIFSDVWNGTGDGNEEWPARVTVVVELGDGSVRRIMMGYNYRGGFSEVKPDVTIVGFGNVAQGVWRRGETFVLQDYYPTMTKIRLLEFGAVGWDYESRFDNVSLTLQGPTPTPTPPVGSELAWVPRAPMPTARGGPAVAVLGNKMYVAGGGPGTCTYTNALEVYDQPSDTWQTLAPMPSAREAMGAVEVDGKIYVIGGAYRCGGGYQSVDTPAVEEYDPSTNTWAIKTSMPTARRELGVAAVGGKVYAFGGAGGPVGSDPMPTAEVYASATDSWRSLPPMPVFTWTARAAAIGSRIYVLPGADTTLLEFDTVTETWAIRASAPQMRDRPAPVSLGGKLFVIGGGQAGSYPSDILVYEPFSDRWQTITRPDSVPWFTPREALGGAVINGKIYAVGGATGPVWFDLNEEATAGPVPPVGGIVELQRDRSSGLTAHQPSSAFPYPIALSAAAAGALLLAAGGWYARRRWLR